MSRPLSSDILYPFIPGTLSDDNIKGIKDIVLTVYDTPEVATVSVPLAQNKAFASLASISLAPLTFGFKAYTPIGGDEFQVRDINFEIIETEGLGSVKSTDGYSTLFVAFSELITPGSPQTMSPLDYVLEPCTVRWLQSAVTEMVMVNEQRLSKPSDRVDLLNTPLMTFDSASPIKVKNGYNIDLNQDENDLKILGNSESGLGKAPDNMWEDIAPPVSVTPLKDINGESPEQDGDFFIETSDHVSLAVEGSKITVIDSSLET